ncbi:hypothetical protein AMECASPLE_018410 [Ameca splendens]|uniref:Uncharacterized protein n=1 Tax=Ameca splendens TaxID=208324 RepID=A0ABV0Y350_9TELE
MRPAAPASQREDCFVTLSSLLLFRETEGQEKMGRVWAGRDCFHLVYLCCAVSNFAQKIFINCRSLAELSTTVGLYVCMLKCLEGLSYLFINIILCSSYAAWKSLEFEFKYFQGLIMYGI